MWLFPTGTGRRRLAASALLAFLCAWVMSDRAPVAAHWQDRDQHICQPSLTDALSTIHAETPRHPVRFVLAARVVKAWFLFRTGKTRPALAQLDLALRLVARWPKHLPAESREKIVSAITALRTCLATGQSPQTAMLTVRTFLLDENAPNQTGAPAGAGVYIRVDGELVGRTGADGTLRVRVPSGTVVVQAIVPSTSEGQAEIVLAPGASGEVAIVLDDSKEVVERTALTLVEQSDGVLPVAFTSFTLQFEQAGLVVPLERIEQIELLDRDGNVAQQIGPLFTLTPAGPMVASDVEALRTALGSQATNEIVVRVHAVDAAGFTHANDVRFRLGQFRVVVTLTPPPSNPALAVDNIEVKVSLLGTSVSFIRVSDAAGRFEIPSIPIGNIGFESQTLQGGAYYYGQGTLFLNADRAVSLIMRSVADVSNGVPPLTSGPIVTGLLALADADVAVAPEVEQARREADAALVPPASASSGISSLAAAATASVFVAAGQQDVPSTQTATLDVPLGTKTVTLTYTVFSAEYPFYVMQQSIFNDIWSLAVFGGAGGQQIFQITRNVNAQLFVAPVWQADSTTGTIEEVLDVEALAANGDITLTLTASSTNIGDSALTTTVTAELSADVELTINDIEADTVTPTTGDSSFYSIPRPGLTNTFARRFTLRLAKPDQATITSVRVIVRGPGDLQTIFEEGPGDNVEIVDDQRIRVRVSMHTVTSSVNSTPPPAHNLTYRFRVRADFNGQTIEDERDSSIRRGLWRMPDGFARYGARDAGGDDWASRGAYVWLDQYRALVTRIDDISGEHARDIGHTTHERGVDIDEFHYYTFPGGGGSGGANYTALRNNVIAALNGDAAAAGRVGSWVAATRVGLDNLLALNTVNTLYYAIGSAHQQAVTPTRTIRLNAGWARDLMRNGSITAASGEALDTGLGAWAQATSNQVVYNAVHNSHVHIALNSTALPN